MDSKFTILLADDNPDDLQLLSYALRKADIINPIQTVANGKEAIAYLCAEAPYDDRTKYPFPGVIILDIKMPLVDGLEVLEWLNKHPGCSVIPSIVMSASAEPSDVKRAYSLGVSTYFQKPGSINGLVEVMRAIQLYWGLAVRPKLPEKC